MRNAWKKRLTALALTTVMAIGLTPAALAVSCGHNNWGSWQKLNDTQHQRRCLTSGCTGTEESNHNWGTAYQASTTDHWKKCADCGAETAHEKHTYSGTMRTDDSNHWDQCTVCGYKDNLGGHVDLNNDGKCDTCGYSVGVATITATFMNGTRTYKTQSVKKGAAPTNPGTPVKTGCTFVGWTTRNPGSDALYTGQSYLTAAKVTQTALSANTTYYALYTLDKSALSWTVKPGEELEFDKDDFEDLFDAAYGDDDTFRYVTFDADSSLKSSSGTLYVNRGTTSEKTFDRYDLEDYDFYDSRERYGDYPLDGLSFVAAADAKGKTVTLDFTLYGDDEELDGTLEINVTTRTSSSDADLVYEVDPGDEVAFDRADFKELFDDEYDDDSFRYAVFKADSSYKSSNGYIYYDYDGSDEEKFSKSDLSDNDFYYSSSRYGDYPLDELSFVADSDADGEVVTLDFTLYGDDEELDGTLKIRIGDVDEDDGDITYTVDEDGEAALDRSDFSRFYKDNASGSLRYVRFYPDNAYKSVDGALYFDYNGKDEEGFSKSELEDRGCTFYYNSSDYGEYELDEVTFVAGDDFDEALSIDFRAYGDDGKYAKGTLVIQPEKTDDVSGFRFGNIRYNTSGTTPVQINANDIVRFFKQKYPSGTLQSVELKGVPSSGSLYHDYYANSGRKQITSSNYKSMTFYWNASGSQYSLNKLTYIPAGTNRCVGLPFTATGTAKQTVQGVILISVTRSAIAEVYSVTPRNTAVLFPATAIYNAVYNSTGVRMASIQLLELPASGVGSVTVDGVKADILTRYGYSSGTKRMSQLKFTPASGYTGSAAIPYVAYDSSNNAIAAGTFSVGVVKNVKKFSDVTATTWCYKYVTELSDGGVIGGYSDSSFRPNGTVTYGAALKLVMLAAGYSEQAPTGSHTFSGYLTKAKADGLVSGNVDLNQAITRLEVSRLAAKAMKLSTSSLSDVKTFTDTSDPYVQALNAAGIVEGYFSESSGTSTFKPNGTLTRGQVSAIVWRMSNYQ